MLVATALAAVFNTYTARAVYAIPHHNPSLATTGGGAWWGIDTVSNVQTGNIIAQTTTDLGAPQFIGRYLIYSSELSSTEAQYIHQHGVSILLIDDPSRTFTSGSTEADQAITQASALGVPHGVAIFRDIETSDAITATYIAAYVAAFAGSGYVAGFYENPINGAFAGAYCSLVARQSSGRERHVPVLERAGAHGQHPRRSARPHYAPDVPGCANHTAAWQYLERGLFPPGTWPNVDVDELPSRFSGVLWAFSRDRRPAVILEAVLTDELIPGIVRPDTPAAAAADEVAITYCTPVIVNHCLRSYVWARGMRRTAASRLIRSCSMSRRCSTTSGSSPSSTATRCRSRMPADTSPGTLPRSGGLLRPAPQSRRDEIVVRHMRGAELSEDAEGYLPAIATGLDVSGPIPSGGRRAFAGTSSAPSPGCRSARSSCSASRTRRSANRRVPRPRPSPTESPGASPRMSSTSMVPRARTSSPRRG